MTGDVRVANSRQPRSGCTLAIETSCDDTCAAVVRDRAILSNVISSQPEHDAFGGVVPEVAARSHLRLIDPVVQAALHGAGVEATDIERVAVTAGPGLSGALLTGLAYAKAFAVARGLPLIAVDHLHGHICASFLEPDPAEPPQLSLIASGGHTFLAAVRGHEVSEIEILGRTLDDAAGEALDKGARMLGLPFPGGAPLQALAEAGDPEAFELPRAAGVAGLDFSFAGLKTALLYLIRDLGESEAQARRADLAASYQHAVIEQLATRVERGIRETGLTRLAIGGGVAANGPLRQRLRELTADLHVPHPELCTDNAAMIAAAADFTAPLRGADALTAEVYATGQRGLV